MENSKACLTWKEKALSMLGWTTKRYKGISIAYMAMLFVTFPLIELLIIFRNKDIYVSAGVINMASFNVVGAMFAFVAILFTAIFSIVAFSYMHNKRCVDLFGSLPVSRRTLFFTRYLSVVIQTLVPLVGIGIIGGILTLKSAYFMSTIKMIALLALGLIGIISFIAVLSLCCGTVVDVVVSFFVINGVYPICILICNVFPASILPGFGIKGSVNYSLYTMLSPLVAPFAGIWENEKGLYIIWWMLFSIVLIGICYILSKKRKAETAQNAFVFVTVEQIIKFFSGFAVGFGMGWIFAGIGSGSSESYKSQYVWFFVGLCIGAFLTAMILHLIYHRGISLISSSLLVGAADVVVAIVFVMIIITGAFGYDERVPDVQDVQSVSVDLEGLGSYHVNGVDIRENYIHDEQLIKQVVAAHKVIRKQEMKRKQGTYPIEPTNFEPVSYEGEEDYISTAVTISYQLKNGQIMNREYIGYYKQDEVRKLSQSLKYYANPFRMLTKVPVNEIGSIELTDKNDMRINLDGGIEKIRKIKDAVIKDYRTLKTEKIESENEIYTLYFSCYNSRGESMEIKVPITEKCMHTMKILDGEEYKNKELIYLEETVMFSEEEDSDTQGDKKTVYFKVPDDWDSKAKVYAVLYDYEMEEFSSDGFENPKNLCKNVKGNLWAYTYHDMNTENEDGYFYTRIMFYQILEDKVNLSGCVKLPDSLKNKCLVLGKKKKVSIDEHDEAMYKYQWEKMKQPY